MHVFSLSFFLFAGCLVLLYLLLGIRFPAHEIGRRKAVNRFLGAFIGLWGLALLMFHQYVYPSQDIYSNGAYHHLAHEGFQFEETLSLIDETQPASAIWDQREGKLAVKAQAGALHLVAENPGEPLFLQDSSGMFTLVQADQQAFAFEDSLQIYLDQKEQFCLKIQPHPKQARRAIYQLRYGETSDQPDTSYFNRKIFRGIPLAEILHPNKLQPESLSAWGQAYLLRAQLTDPDNPTLPDPKGLGALYFLPGPTLAKEGSLRIVCDGKTYTYQPHTYDLPLKSGQDFFMGLGRERSPLVHVSPYQDAWQLAFRRPQTYPLLSQMEAGQKTTLFIHSLGEEMLRFDPGTDSLAGGYHLNYFHRDDNQHHIGGLLRYRLSSSRAPLAFQLVDYNQQEKQAFQHFQSGDRFSLHAQEADINWNFKLVDRRSENPLSLFHIHLFLFTLVLVICLRYSLFFQGAYLSRVEMGIYVIMLCFLSVRLLILWRVSTFPPLEQIDAKSLHILVDQAFTHFIWTAILSLGFLLSWFVLLWFKQHRSWTFRLQSSFLLVVLGCCVLVVGLAQAHISFFERLANIYVPLLLFFLLDQKILQLAQQGFHRSAYPSASSDKLWQRWRDRLQDWVDKQSWDDPRFIRLMRLGLFAGIFSYIGIQDAGFAIMFGLFCWLHYGISWIITRPPEYRWAFFPKRLRPLAPWLSFLACVGGFGIMIYMQDRLITFLLTGDHLWWTLGVGLILGLGGLGYYLQKHFEFFRLNMPMQGGKTWQKAGLTYLVGALLLMSAWGLSQRPLSSIVRHHSYIKYRAAILEQPVGELMAQEAYASRETMQIQRAAHNQWLIHFYLTQGSDNQEFFALQPHFTQGATHLTQVSDLVIPRYLIAEHSEWVVIWLMLQLLLLPLIFFRGLSYKLNPAQFSLLGIPMLIFTTSFFVWMTATNRFTFFGQDFPLLPFSSKITLILTYSLWLLLLVLYDPILEEARHTRQRIPFHLRAWQYQKQWSFAGVLVLLSIIFYLTPRQADNARNSRHYDIGQLIDTAQFELSQLNTAFLRYQEKIGYPPQEIDSLLADFHRQYYLPEQDSSRSISPFFQAAYWDHFLDRQADKRNPEAFIHVRRRGDREYLSLNRKYFFLSSPRPEVHEDMPHLLAAQTTKSQGFIDQMGNFVLPSHQGLSNQHLSTLEQDMLRALKEDPRHYANLKLAFVPGSWTREEQGFHLVRDLNRSPGGEQVNQAHFSLTNQQFHFASQRQASTQQARTLRLKLNDWIRFQKAGPEEKGVRLKLVAEKSPYLAKQMWINGHQQYLYPLGKEFPWTFHYTQLLRQLGQAADTIPNLLRDARQLSIDYKLTQEAYAYMQDPVQLPATALAPLLAFRNAGFQEKMQGVNGIQLVVRKDKHLLQAVEKMPKALSQQLTAINQHLLANPDYVIQKGDHLTENLQLNAAIHEQVQSRYDMALVGVEGSGAIRVMADYHRIPGVDPNDARSYHTYLHQLYKASNTQLEKEAFGNRNLIKAPGGMGSSLKPFVYAGMISQVAMDWEDVHVEQASDAMLDSLMEKNPKTGKDALKYFAGKRFPHKVYWNSLEEKSFKGPGLKSEAYLTYSNNLYHGSLFLLGSYPISQLRNQDPKQLLKRLPASGFPQDKDISYYYPVINWDGQRWAFQEWPDFSHPYTPLSLGLHENFGLATQGEHLSAQLGLPENYQAYGGDPQAALLQHAWGKAIGHVYWVFPEKSHFIQQDREAAPKTRKGLINPVLGAYPVELTPLKMAEMGVGLFTLNREFKASVQEGPQTRKVWSMDPAWGQEEALLEMLQQQVYAPMHEVITQGTAQGLKKLAKKYDGKYWFYAKTGTTGASERTETAHLRGKRLLVIITNRPVHQGELDWFWDEQSRQDYKVYSLFISVDKIPRESFNARYGGNWSGVQPLIEQVIQSPTFQTYMQTPYEYQ
ncbi:MAG: hypothetical protein AAFR61_27915 [Bacteroidota bacterium]